MIQTRNGKPCIDVKLRTWRELTDAEVAELRSQFAEHVTREWLQAKLTDTSSEWERSAVEQELDMAQDEATAVFGAGVKVSLEGRSGGWLVVDGLPAESEAWDAPWARCPDSDGWNLGEGSKPLSEQSTLRERWEYFSACAEACVKDFPRRVAELIALSARSPAEEREESISQVRAAAAALGFDLIPTDGPHDGCHGRTCAVRLVSSAACDCGIELEEEES